MRIAESVRGSSPRVFIRLNVSRQEMPASTRILVQVLATTAQFPRLPLASMETHTPMHAAYAPALWIGSNFLGKPIPKGELRAAGFRVWPRGPYRSEADSRNPSYFPCLKLSITRRMIEPPYAPAIPGRNAR